MIEGGSRDLPSHVGVIRPESSPVQRVFSFSHSHISPFSGIVLIAPINRP